MARYQKVPKDEKNSANRQIDYSFGLRSYLFASHPFLPYNVVFKNLVIDLKDEASFQASLSKYCEFLLSKHIDGIEEKFQYCFVINRTISRIKEHSGRVKAYANGQGTINKEQVTELIQYLDALICLLQKDLMCERVFRVVFPNNMEDFSFLKKLILYSDEAEVIYKALLCLIYLVQEFKGSNKLKKELIIFLKTCTNFVNQEKVQIYLRNQITCNSAGAFQFDFGINYKGLEYSADDLATKLELEQSSCLQGAKKIYALVKGHPFEKDLKGSRKLLFYLFFSKLLKWAHSKIEKKYPLLSLITFDIALSEIHGSWRKGEEEDEDSNDDNDGSENEDEDEEEEVKEEEGDLDEDVVSESETESIGGQDMSEESCPSEENQLEEDKKIKITEPVSSIQNSTDARANDNPKFSSKAPELNPESYGAVTKLKLHYNIGKWMCTNCLTRDMQKEIFWLYLSTSYYSSFIQNLSYFNLNSFGPLEQIMETLLVAFSEHRGKGMSAEDKVHNLLSQFTEVCDKQLNLIRFFILRQCNEFIIDINEVETMIILGNLKTDIQQNYMRGFLTRISDARNKVLSHILEKDSFFDIEELYGIFVLGKAFQPDFQIKFLEELSEVIVGQIFNILFENQCQNLRPLDFDVIDSIEILQNIDCDIKKKIQEKLTNLKCLEEYILKEFGVNDTIHSKKLTNLQFYLFGMTLQCFDEEDLITYLTSLTGEFFPEKIMLMQIWLHECRDRGFEIPNTLVETYFSLMENPNSYPYLSRGFITDFFYLLGVGDHKVNIDWYIAREEFEYGMQEMKVCINNSQNFIYKFSIDFVNSQELSPVAEEFINHFIVLNCCSLKHYYGEFTKYIGKESSLFPVTSTTLVNAIQDIFIGLSFILGEPVWSYAGIEKIYKNFPSKVKDYKETLYMRTLGEKIQGELKIYESMNNSLKSFLIDSAFVESYNNQNYHKFIRKINDLNQKDVFQLLKINQVILVCSFHLANISRLKKIDLQPSLSVIETRILAEHFYFSLKGIAIDIIRNGSEELNIKSEPIYQKNQAGSLLLQTIFLFHNIKNCLDTAKILVESLQEELPELETKQQKMLYKICCIKYLFEEVILDRNFYDNNFYLLEKILNSKVNQALISRACNDLLDHLHQSRAHASTIEKYLDHTITVFWEICKKKLTEIHFKDNITLFEWTFTFTLQYCNYIAKFQKERVEGKMKKMEQFFKDQLKKKGPGFKMSVPKDEPALIKADSAGDTQEGTHKVDLLKYLSSKMVSFFFNCLKTESLSLAPDFLDYVWRRFFPREPTLKKKILSHILMKFGLLESQDEPVFKDGQIVQELNSLGYEGNVGLLCLTLRLLRFNQISDYENLNQPLLFTIFMEEISKRMLQNSLVEEKAYKLCELKMLKSEFYFLVFSRMNSFSEIKPTTEEILVKVLGLTEIIPEEFGESFENLIKLLQIFKAKLSENDIEFMGIEATNAYYKRISAFFQKQKIKSKIDDNSLKLIIKDLTFLYESLISLNESKSLFNKDLHAKCLMLQNISPSLKTSSSEKEKDVMQEFAGEHKSNLIDTISDKEPIVEHPSNSSNLELEIKRLSASVLSKMIQGLLDKVRKEFLAEEGYNDLQLLVLLKTIENLVFEKELFFLLVHLCMDFSLCDLLLRRLENSFSNVSRFICSIYIALKSHFCESSRIITYFIEKVMGTLYSELFSKNSSRMKKECILMAICYFIHEFLYKEDKMKKCEEACHLILDKINTFSDLFRNKHEETSLKISISILTKIYLKCLVKKETFNKMIKMVPKFFFSTSDFLQRLEDSKGGSERVYPKILIKQINKLNSFISNEKCIRSNFDIRMRAYAGIDKLIDKKDCKNPFIEKNVTYFFRPELKRNLNEGNNKELKKKNTNKDRHANKRLFNITYSDSGKDEMEDIFSDLENFDGVRAVDNINAPLITDEANPILQVNKTISEENQEKKEETNGKALIANHEGLIANEDEEIDEGSWEEEENDADDEDDEEEFTDSRNEKLPIVLKITSDQVPQLGVPPKEESKEEGVINTMKNEHKENSSLHIQNKLQDEFDDLSDEKFDDLPNVEEEQRTKNEENQTTHNPEVIATGDKISGDKAIPPSDAKVLASEKKDQGLWVDMEESDGNEDEDFNEDDEDNADGELVYEDRDFLAVKTENEKSKESQEKTEDQKIVPVKGENTIMVSEGENNTIMVSENERDSKYEVPILVKTFDFTKHGLPEDCLKYLGIDEEFFYGLDNEDEQIGILTQPEFREKLKEYQNKDQSDGSIICSSDRSENYYNDNDYEGDYLYENDVKRDAFNKNVKKYMSYREQLCFTEKDDKIEGKKLLENGIKALESMPNTWKKFYEDEIYKELPEFAAEPKVSRPTKAERSRKIYNDDQSIDGNQSENSISSLSVGENKKQNFDSDEDGEKDYDSDLGAEHRSANKRRGKPSKLKEKIRKKGRKAGGASSESEVLPKETYSIINSLPKYEDDAILWIFRTLIYVGEREIFPKSIWKTIILNPVCAVKIFKLMKIAFSFYRKSYISKEDSDFVCRRLIGCAPEGYDKIMEVGIEQLLQLLIQCLQKKQGIEYIFECQSERFDSVSFPLIDGIYKKYKLNSKGFLELTIKIQDDFNEQQNFFKLILSFYSSITFTEKTKEKRKFSMISQAKEGSYELLISKEGFSKRLWRYFQSSMSLPVFKYICNQLIAKDRNNYVFIFKTILLNFSDKIFKSKIEKLAEAIFKMNEDEFDINIGFLEGFTDYLAEEDDLKDFSLAENFNTFFKMVKFLIGLGRKMDEELQKSITDEAIYENKKNQIIENLKTEMKQPFESFNKFISFCLAILAKLYFVYEHTRHVDIEEDYEGKIHELYFAFLPCIKAFFVIFSFLNPKSLKKTADQHPHYFQRSENLMNEPASLDIKRTVSLSLTKAMLTEEQYELERKKLNNSELWRKDCGKISEFATNFEMMGDLFGWVLQHFLKMDEGRNNKYFEIFMADPNLSKTVDLNIRMSYIRCELVRKYNNEVDEISLKIDRANIFEITYQKFSKLDSKAIALGNFDISFVKEEGNDQGGLTREFLTCLGKEIFDPQKGLFVITSNKVTIQPSSSSGCVPDHLNIFKFIGRLLAKVVINGLFIEVNFTKPFLKQIFDVRLNIQDLEDVDHDLSKNLIWLLNNDIGDGSDVHIFFSYQENQFGKLTEVPLKNDGGSIMVNETNKIEYVNLVCESKMITQIKAQTTAFKEGFFEIYPKEFLHLLNWRELGIKLSGTPTIDVQDMQKNTKYNGYYEGSAFIKWFWEIINEFDEVTKASFLFFVSGSFKVPHGGFKAFGFEVNKSYDDLENLPVAHTCFNSIDLPEYQSKEILREKLLKAILEGNQGFGMG